MLKKNIIIVSISKYISSGINFLIPLFLPLYLSQIDIGYIASFQSYYALLIPVVGISTQGYLLRHFHHNDHGMPTLLLSSLIILIGSFIIVLLGVIFFSGLIEKFIPLPKIWLHQIPFLVLIFEFNLLLTTIYDASLQALKSSAVQIIRVLGTTSVLFFGVIVFDMNWEARPLSFLIIDSILAVILLILFKSQLQEASFAFENRTSLKKTIRDNLHYSLPLVPHTLSMWVMFSVSIFFINFYLGADKSALFFIANTFALVVGLLQDSIITAWNPWFFKALNNQQLSKRLFVKYAGIFAVFLLVVTVAVSVGSYFLIPIIYAPVYEEAALIVPFLALGYFFNGIYKFAASIIFYTKNTSLLLKSSLSSALINIILQNILVPTYKIQGAAIATMVSFCLCMIFVLQYSFFEAGKIWTKDKL